MFKVSILIPVYNSEEYLDESILSAINQTYGNIEIIVVDDGSTDNSLAIAKKYISDNLKVYSKANSGECATNNYALKLCTGDYVKFLDHDDIISPENLEIQVNQLNGRQDIVAFGEWARFHKDYQAADFSKNIEFDFLKPLDFLTFTETGMFLQGGNLLLPAGLIKKAGNWNEKLVLFNDTEFFTRIILNSGGVKFTKGAKLYYRSGLSTNESNRKGQAIYESAFYAAGLVEKLMLCAENTDRVKKVCANNYQMLVYGCYLVHPELVAQMEEKINNLGGSTYLYKFGNFLSIVRNFCGWRFAFKIKFLLYRLGFKRLLGFFDK